MLYRDFEDINTSDNIYLSYTFLSAFLIFRPCRIIRTDPKSAMTRNLSLPLRPMSSMQLLASSRDVGVRRIGCVVVNWTACWFKLQGDGCPSALLNRSLTASKTRHHKPAITDAAALIVTGFSLTPFPLLHNYSSHDCRLTAPNYLCRSAYEQLAWCQTVSSGLWEKTGTVSL